MSDFEVDNDYPLPAVAAPRGRKEKYPWTKLEIGGSFFVPDGDLKAMNSCAAKAKKRTGLVFTARRVEGGVRVWRYE